jgi:hypothetical protein
LNTIPLNRKQSVCKSDPDRDTVLADCASRQDNHLVDRRIKIKALLSRRRFLDVLTDPVDEVSGAIGIAYGAAERFPDLAEAAVGPKNSGPHGRCCARWRSVA